MKKIFVLNFLFFVACMIAFQSFVNSQDMKKPDPVKNATLDMIMGTWVAEPYEMMGSKWNEEANHYIKYNGQFMCIDISSKNDKGEEYNGTVVMKLKNDGTFTGWSFDDWGMIVNYTGSSNGNKVTVNGTSDWGSEVREIEINGNNMVHNISWKMKGADGKETESKMTINYKKK